MGTEKQDGATQNDDNRLKATSFHHANKPFSEQHLLSERAEQTCCNNRNEQWGQFRSGRMWVGGFAKLADEIYGQLPKQA